MNGKMGKGSQRVQNVGFAAANVWANDFGGGTSAVTSGDAL